MRRLKILTWHVHGSYLYYLSQVPHEIYLPVREGRPEGYGGRAGSMPWPDNLHEIPADEVRRSDFDVVLFQSRRNYEVDQHEILSPRQRRLPRIYLEHDPPRESPTDTRHPAAGDDLLLVHVTPFNNLMWDNGFTPSRVIEHGVVVPEDVAYTGELARGLVVVNGMGRRGRRLGDDIFEYVRRRVPLDLVGMGSEELGGLGEVSHRDLPAFAARYRFFFNPIRYTSLGLAVCEAMMLGMPIVGLATTEMATTIDRGGRGYVDTNVPRLIDRMHRLLDHPEDARRLGDNARKYARRRFSIDRFVRDWNEAFESGTGVSRRLYETHRAGE
jgi:glycosyltransferase involved in cell wall biosynthesis